LLQNLKSHVDVDFVGDCNGLLIVMLILMATMLMLIVRLADFLVLVGKWADPGGTAMPGQPATRPEQAPEPHPLAKISLISKGAHGPRIRY